MKKILARTCASLCGVGFVPIMPGTAGSLVALLIAWLFLPASLMSMGFCSCIAFLCGLMVTHYATDGQGDPSWVVIDELAGMWVALIGVSHTPAAFVLAFILFRMLDIFKPFGINAVQRLPGCWGVMLDDVVAGLVAAMLMRIIFYIKPF